VKLRLPCQDFALCKEVSGPDGSVLAAVVSDGAGSASHALGGAKTVCIGFLRAAIRHFAAGRQIEDLDDNEALHWLDDIRDRIYTYARKAHVRPRDCAATLVGLLAGPRSALIMHVGDGAAVVREEGTPDWLIPSWPFHGEYASSTRFVTDDPLPPPSVARLALRLDRIAVFSDGIERLVLDHTLKTAHVPFFERMTAAVAASNAGGLDSSLARPLRDYLNSDTLCERTDDDKSLILAVRP